jgi:hypothetical protein
LQALYRSLTVSNPASTLATSYWSSSSNGPGSGILPSKCL